MGCMDKFALWSGTLLFSGSVVLIIVYIFCTGDVNCKFSAGVYASPAWTAALIMLAALFGLYMIERKKVENRTWVVILLLFNATGFITSIVCLVFIFTRENTHRGLWVAIVFLTMCLCVFLTMCLCVTLFITSGVFVYRYIFPVFRSQPKSGKLSTGNTEHRGATEITATKREQLGKTASGDQPSPDPEGAAYYEVSDTLPQHIYSSSITEKKPPESTYQPLIFENRDKEIQASSGGSQDNSGYDNA